MIKKLLASAFITIFSFTCSASESNAKIQERITPFLLPFDHPAKNLLDHIFSFSRFTADDQTLLDADFEILSIQPRSYVRILKHPLLPDFLFKAYVDAETRKKKNLDSWQWLVKRCEGAAAVRHIIKKKKIKFFTVPDKWIYLLPETLLPPDKYSPPPHLALLLVTDMRLASSKECLYAWKHQITKEHLDELYQIISYAKGSSYRPDNIPLTIDGTFAFIDTEYPSHKPDYDSIKSYLCPEMSLYWEKLTQRGGL